MHNLTMSNTFNKQNIFQYLFIFVKAVHCSFLSAQVYYKSH